MFGFSKNTLESVDKSLFFHEDYSDRDVNEALVGRKGKSLFELKDIDVPVPDFFVISPHVYKSFLLKAFDHKLVALLEKVKTPDIKELEKLILEADFDTETIDEIYKGYSRLSGFANAWVAVRSSVVYPQDTNVTFSGVFDTALNVRGMDSLVDAIKQIYISVFRNRVILYSQDHSVDLSELQMAIVVQKMVQPEVSGVAYTIDPVTNDSSRMNVEAVFGLGDVISDGSITPDQYVVLKKGFEITEKNISPQEWMKIRKPGDRKPGEVEEYQKIQISKTWSHQQKLEDRNLREVAKVALIIEERSKQAQNVEWVWESGNVWILQSKPLTQIAQKAQGTPAVKSEETLFDVAIDIIKEEKLKESSTLSETLGKQNVKDANEEFVKRDVDIKKEVSTLEKLSAKLASLTASSNKTEEKKASKESAKVIGDLDKVGAVLREEKSVEFLLTGIGASHGETTGVVKVISTPVPDGIVVTRENILLLKGYDQEVSKLVMKSGGILMDDGGLTSDVSMLARESNIPAVVGTGLATALVKDGDVIKIDGNVGSVYRILKPSTKTNSEYAPLGEAVDRRTNEERSIHLAAQRAKLDAMKEAAQRNRVDKDDKADETISTPKKAVDVKERIATATKVMLMPENPVDADRYTSIIGVVDGVCYIDLDQVFLSDKRHPLAYVESKGFREYSKKIEQLLDDYTDCVGANEVIVSIGAGTAGLFRSLIKGSAMEDKDLGENIYGVAHYMANKELLKRALSIVKKVRNVYKSRNLSLAIHSPMNGEMMQQIKKEISAAGLKRTGTFNIYAVLDNPAEIILTEDILQAGIDGVIINTPRIARQMQGLGLYDESAKYDISTASVFKIIESSIRQIKVGKSRVIVMVDDCKKLIERCVEWGVYGVGVKPEYFDSAKKIVSDEESKMIMRISIPPN